jgi:ABC-type sugar transport system permease subunit
LPKIVLAPSFAIMVIFVYGFIAFTIYLSFTDSRMLPSYDWVGWQNYDRLFRISPVGHLGRQPRDLRVALHRHQHHHRPDAGDLPRPEDPGRGRAAADLSLSHGAQLHRDRHRVEMDARPGHRASRTRMQALGLGELQLRLDQGPRLWRSTRS